MSASPINSANSIDAAAFAVIFDRPFSEKEEIKLLALKEILKLELPDFSRTTKITLKNEAGKQPEHTVQESGVKLQKYEPSGKIGWVLNVVENQIIITCQTYDRWLQVWSKVENLLQNVFKFLDLDSLAVQACVLQYVDRFTENLTTNYTLYGVFNKRSPYLTSKAANAGNLWHVHQGWFEEGSPEQKILNVLNLGTNVDAGKIVTTIDHSLQLQYIKPKNAKKFFLGKNAEYKRDFLSLHVSNKHVIKLALNPKQRDAIGLV